MRQPPMLLCGMVLLGTVAAVPAFAQVSAEISSQQLQRQQQRERAQSEANDSQPDVRLPRASHASAMDGYGAIESPCFTIREIVLQGDEAARFQWALDEVRDACGMCLGSLGVNAVLTGVQNALVAAGYVTTRVLAAKQDLGGGMLALRLVPGRIHAIRLAELVPGASERHVSIATAVPAKAGDILNLRDVEQALENLKRVPTAEADIQIVPAELPGESDLVIAWRQALPVRLSLSVDDSGSDATGKRQGGVTVSLDNVLGLNELFYVNANRDLAGEAARDQHGTRSYAANYSMPYGDWLLSSSVNSYRYYQTVAGANEDYVYRGTSRNADLKLARLLYRDGTRKLSASLRAYQRLSSNFVDDTEVEVQRRRTAGIELGLADKEFIGQATVDASLGYKIGMHVFGALPAPEETFGEGSSTPRIVSAELTLALPFNVAGVPLNYQGDWRGQWSDGALTPQDRFAIGGRYTVRGFDGENSLSAARGSLLRNELGWTLAAGQQLYLALDVAAVSGPGAMDLAGTSLAGAALGWRGQWHGLQYDLFSGAPLRRPEHFRTARVASGFSLNYQF